MKIVKLTPAASQDMEYIWYYSCRHFDEEEADGYINQIFGIFHVLSTKNIGTPRPELGRIYLRTAR